MKNKEDEGEAIDTGHFIVLSLAILLFLAPSFGVFLCQTPVRQFKRSGVTLKHINAQSHNSIYDHKLCQYTPTFRKKTSSVTHKSHLSCLA